MNRHNSKLNYLSNLSSNRNFCFLCEDRKNILRNTTTKETDKQMQDNITDEYLVQNANNSKARIKLVILASQEKRLVEFIQQ